MRNQRHSERDGVPNIVSLQFRARQTLEASQAIARLHGTGVHFQMQKDYCGPAWLDRLFPPPQTRPTILTPAITAQGTMVSVAVPSNQSLRAGSNLESFERVVTVNVARTREGASSPTSSALLTAKQSSSEPPTDEHSSTSRGFTGSPQSDRTQICPTRCAPGFRSHPSCGAMLQS